MSDLRPRARRSRSEPIARHARLRRSHPFTLVLKFVAAALAVVLVSGASIGAIVVNQLAGNIKTVTLAADDSDEPIQQPPPLGKYEGGFNLLIVGSDVCDRPDGCKNEDREGMRNDVTMLVHVAADQSSAVAVSFPRDLIVPIPECPRENGDGTYNAMSAQPINVTLSYGGLPCTVETVEALTGLDIQYAGMITFEGVKGMSSAVGGVPVCIDGPLVDRLANNINLPSAGIHYLEGEQALGFLRSRHGVGNGGDLGRISSQQMFLSSLIRQIKSDSTLNDPAKLFKLATAATKNMTLSDHLAPPNTLISMALVLKDVPLERIVFAQYPAASGRDALVNKVVPIKFQADALFAKITADEAFLPETTGVGSALAPTAETPAPEAPTAPIDPAASPVPEAPTEPEVVDGVLGQTAADETCSRTNN